MQYVKIALTDEVKDGEKKKVALDDKTLLLTKYQGTYYVIDKKCPHMGGSLYDGKLEGYRITCPRHGSVFDVRTGKVLQNGKLAFIKVRVGDDKAYPVKVEGSGIFVGLE